MRSPRDRYASDPAFHHLVDLIEVMIERAEFSPSEIREAAMLACINHEMRHIRPLRIDRSPELDHALNVLQCFTENPKRSPTQTEGGLPW